MWAFINGNVFSVFFIAYQDNRHLYVESVIIIYLQLILICQFILNINNSEFLQCRFGFHKVPKFIMKNVTLKKINNFG